MNRQEALELPFHSPLEHKPTGFRGYLLARVENSDTTIKLILQPRGTQKKLSKEQRRETGYQYLDHLAPGEMFDCHDCFVVTRKKQDYGNKMRKKLKKRLDKKPRLSALREAMEKKDERQSGKLKTKA